MPRKDYRYYNQRIGFWNGYNQASYEIKLGLRPIFVWSISSFWLGYDLAILTKRK